MTSALSSGENGSFWTIGLAGERVALASSTRAGSASPPAATPSTVWAVDAELALVDLETAVTIASLSCRLTRLDEDRLVQRDPGAGQELGDGRERRKR